MCLSCQNSVVCIWFSLGQIVYISLFPEFKLDLYHWFIAVFQTFGTWSDSNKCPICGKILRYVSNMKKHIEDMHQMIRRFRCSFCGKGFSRRQNLQGHMSTVHNCNKEHKCLDCGKEFGYKRYLTQHMKIAHSSNWGICIVKKTVGSGYGHWMEVVLRN